MVTITRNMHYIEIQMLVKLAENYPKFLHYADFIGLNRRYLKPLVRDGLIRIEDGRYYYITPAGLAAIGKAEIATEAAPVAGTDAPEKHQPGAMSLTGEDFASLVVMQTHGGCWFNPDGMTVRRIRLMEADGLVKFIPEKQDFAPKMLLFKLTELGHQTVNLWRAARHNQPVSAAPGTEDELIDEPVQTKPLAIHTVDNCSAEVAALRAENARLLSLLKVVDDYATEGLGDAAGLRHAEMPDNRRYFVYIIDTIFPVLAAALDEGGYDVGLMAQFNRTGQYAQEEGNDDG